MTSQKNPANWAPPEGLGYSSLRPVCLSAQGKALGAVGALFLVAGPVLAVVIASQSSKRAERDALLDQQGVVTTAVVTRIWRNGGKDERHMVSYRFAAASREIDAEVSAPRRVWTGLHGGDSLAVRYVPSRPEINHPVAWKSSRAPGWLGWVIAPIIILPSLLLWSLIRRQWLLLAEGRPAPGIITRLKRSDKQMVAEYEFRVLSGALMKGRSGTGRPPAIGSQVCVLYHPDNPRRNALYPMPFVKLQRD